MLHPEPMDERLLTFLYQYGLGGLVFVLTLVLLWRAGMLGSEPRVRRRRVLLLCLGVLGYAAVHALLQFVAPHYDLSLWGG